MATETLTRSRITLDFQPPVARIGLHNPPLNVIDVAMMDELAPVAATALAALVGHKHAADLILTGRTISGAEAARIGLANRAIADAEVEPVVQETIQQLSTLSPAALAIAKKANYAWDAMHFDK